MLFIRRPLRGVGNCQHYPDFESPTGLPAALPEGICGHATAKTRIAPVIKIIETHFQCKLIWFLQRNALHFLGRT